MIDAAVVRLLLEASLRALLLAAAVGGVLTLARVRQGSVRHSAWATVVVTMLFMPVLVFVVPQVELSRTSRAIAFLPDPADLPYIGDVNFAQRVGVETSPAIASVAGAANLKSAPQGIQPAAVSAVPAASSLAGFPLWLVAVAAIYAAGLSMLLVRWLRAARFLATLRRGSRRVEAGFVDMTSVYESPMATTPITVGAWRPWIVLPLDWRTWSADKLRAVIAHEHSHVRRHDPLVGLVAYLNRCIYWFNPLAWWLERQLATAAEHAADEAGVKAIGKGRAYAEVLLDMAETVRVHGGRVAWQSVGVDGNGLLGQRIDRVLSGSGLQEVSMMKKQIILVVSVIAVIAAVACKRQIEVPALQPNPKATAAFEASGAMGARYRTAHTMSATDLDALEATVRRNPESLDDRWVLLEFYRERGQSVVGVKRTIDGRREHSLWLMDHHPEAKQTASARIDLTGVLADPAGFAAGKKLWLAQSSQGNLRVAALQNAVSFLGADDPQAAEEIAAAAYERAPNDRAVSLVLANVFASTLTGTNQRYSGATRPTPVVASNPVATRVRVKLEKSVDAGLLAQTGRAVMFVVGFSSPVNEEPARQNLETLGRSYIGRAVMLNPSEPDVAGAAAYMRQLDVQRNAYALRRQDPDVASRAAKVMAMPEAERFPMLASLADDAYMSGEGQDYYQHDAAKAKADFVAAKSLADDLLALASKFKSDPDWSSVVFRAHVVLGLVALRNGDVPAAVTEMKAATDVPMPVAMSFGGQVNKLATTLLQCGERETVAEFYDRSAAFYAGQPGTAAYFKDAAAAIRAGQMTVFMQDQLGYLEREKQWKADMAKNPKAGR